MSSINIKSYGYTEFYEKQIEALNISEKDLIPARIIGVHREQYNIVTEFGEKNARLKGSLFYNGEPNNVYPTIGDFVLVRENHQGDDTIYKVLQRKTKFSRLDTFYKKEQVVASNFDYVFIMTSLNHDFNINRIERYLTVAFQSGAMPIIILTKADLCTDISYYKDQLEKVTIGVPVLSVSSFTGEGLNEFQNYIKPAETIVFLGSSGVGKSSLVNTIAGKEIMKVNDIRDDDSKGHHTTTHRELVMMDNGTMIIDTPGMRELGMWDAIDGLSTTFEDIEELASRCKFRDCGHKAEPGCAVKAALESGELSKDRWDNYSKLRKEAKFAEKKESIIIKLKGKSRMMNIAKLQKQLKNK